MTVQYNCAVLVEYLICYDMNWNAVLNELLAFKARYTNGKMIIWVKHSKKIFLTTL